MSISTPGTSTSQSTDEPKSKHFHSSYDQCSSGSGADYHSTYDRSSFYESTKGSPVNYQASQGNQQKYYSRGNRYKRRRNYQNYRRPDYRRSRGGGQQFQQNFNKKKGPFYHPSFMEDPWADLERAMQLKTTQSTPSATVTSNDDTNPVSGEDSFVTMESSTASDRFEQANSGTSSIQVEASTSQTSQYYQPDPSSTSCNTADFISFDDDN